MSVLHEEYKQVLTEGKKPSVPPEAQEHLDNARKYPQGTYEHHDHMAKFFDAVEKHHTARGVIGAGRAHEANFAAALHRQYLNIFKKPK